MNKQNESGRSLVEMLGVLAIIGVLSIGGITGYRVALRRHHANLIIDASSKLAMVSLVNNRQFEESEIHLAAMGLRNPIADKYAISVGCSEDAAVGQVVVQCQTGETCDPYILRSIESIVGSEKFKNNTTSGMFRYDGEAAGGTLCAS